MKHRLIKAAFILVLTGTGMGIVYASAIAEIILG